MEESPIQLQDGQFRLVTLRRGSLSENIQFSLEIRALSDRPPYHALGRLLHTTGVILGRVVQVQRSSSPRTFKKFETLDDHLKAKKKKKNKKVHGHIEFIAWGSSKQRNRRKSWVNKYYRFTARGRSKQKNRLEAAIKKVAQLTSPHSESCPIAFGSMSARSVLSDGSAKFNQDLNLALQEIAYLTFARAICSFKWGRITA